MTDRNTNGIDPDNDTDPMKTRIISIGLLSAWAVACSIHDPEVSGPDPSPVFHASFEKAETPETRVYATEDLLLRWTADDRVSIFNRNTGNGQYRFTGQTGDNAGDFVLVDEGSSASVDPLDAVYSVYPFSGTTQMDGTGRIALTLPAEQPYAANTFGLGANTMVAASTDNFLMFKNVGGFLLLRLYGDDVSVSSIALRGNQGERIAGDATVTMAVDGVPETAVSEVAGQEITLVCDTPVRIGTSAASATAFWIVVPPTVFSNGFTVKVKDSQNGAFEKAVTRRFEITRSKLARMSALKVVPEPIPAESITLNKATLQLAPGSSVTLTAVVTPDDCGFPVVWTSVNPSVATVSDGTVTGVALGSTVIRATVGSLSAECTVTVTTNAVGDWEDGDHSTGNI